MRARRVSWSTTWYNVGVIVRTKRGYQVKSEKGKNLSADDLSKQEAKERLAQVERFKAWGKARAGRSR